MLKYIRILCSSNFINAYNFFLYSIKDAGDNIEEENFQQKTKIEDQMNNENLEQLQKIFEEADEDNGGGLDIEEFGQAMKMAFGSKLRF